MSRRGKPPKGDGPVELDGAAFKSIVAAACAVLERNTEALNALNVFPVPDGDTGTNMFLTLKAVTEALGEVKGNAVGELASVAAKGALMGARGNSGVILSQFFRGLSKSLDGKGTAGGQDLAFAFLEGSTHAYKAVSQPVEGTMLTVIKEAAHGAQKAAKGDLCSVISVLTAATEAANKAVAQTPQLLPVLAEAGVVDAGGQGFSLMMEGFLACLQEQDPRNILLDHVTPAHGRVSEEFLLATERELYGYCTSFLVTGRGLDPDRIRERLSDLGGSVVVVGDDTMVKVHTHVPDPESILQYGRSLGELTQLKVDNIDEQHKEFRAARRLQATTARITVVSVAWGKGIEAVMEELGATVVCCGRTMNPSVQEILKVLASVPAEDVILLPNNSNVIVAAEEAGKASPRPCHLVPTKSIPEGIAALVAFNPELGVEENLTAMSSAISGVKSGEVVTAVRDARVASRKVGKGQVMGFLNGQLVAVGDNPGQAVKELVAQSCASEGTILTLYWGSGPTREEVLELAQSLRSQFSGTAVEVVFGGQPLCHYILSLE